MSFDGMMKILLNGQPREIPGNLSLLELLREQQIDPVTVVSELNGEIVPRERYAACRLSPEDRLELVRIVGGG